MVLENSKSPDVILLDIDGTIIGDIGFQVCEWEILRLHASKRLPAFRNLLKSHLIKGMIRPHFADFITRLKSLYGNIHFYIYTASDDKWANFLVPCIEAVTNVKFERPIFSRRHCEYDGKVLNKSLTKVAPLIFTRLKHMYPELTSAKELIKHMCIIDNNNVLTDLPHRCILCPTYSYAYPYDVLKHVDETLIEKAIPAISKHMQTYGLLSMSTSSLEQFYTDYYLMLSKMYKAKSQMHKDDNLWIIVMQSITNAYNKGLSTDNMVKYVCQKIQKK